MTAPLPFAAFEVGQPLFGNQWLALLAGLGCIALLLAAVAALGRWLAATHPAPPPKAAAPVVVESVEEMTAAAPVIAGEVPPEIIPVILLAMTSILGSRIRVAAIQRVASPLPAAPSLEALMQQWSYEGRREIYSSHKVR